MRQHHFIRLISPVETGLLFMPEYSVLLILLYVLKSYIQLRMPYRVRPHMNKTDDLSLNSPMNWRTRLFYNVISFLYTLPLWLCGHRFTSRYLLPCRCREKNFFRLFDASCKRTYFYIRIGMAENIITHYRKWIWPCNILLPTYV